MIQSLSVNHISLYLISIKFKYYSTYYLLILKINTQYHICYTHKLSTILMTDMLWLISYALGMTIDYCHYLSLVIY